MCWAETAQPHRRTIHVGRPLLDLHLAFRGAFVLALQTMMSNMNAKPTNAMKHSRRQVVETITQTKSHQADPSTVVENQTRTTFLPPPPPTPAPNPHPEQKHTNTGAVAGGVVGGVVGLALIIAAVCVLLFRRRRNRNKRALDDIYAETGVGGGGTDRHARMRGTQPAVNDIPTTWSANTTIPSQPEMYPQSLGPEADQEPLKFVTPIHSYPEQAANNVENTTPAHLPTYVHEAENGVMQDSHMEGITTTQPGSFIPEESTAMPSTGLGEPLLIKTGSLNRNTSQDLEKSPSSAFMWLPRHKIYGASSAGYTPSDASPYPTN